MVQRRNSNPTKFLKADFGLPKKITSTRVIQIICTIISGNGIPRLPVVLMKLSDMQSPENGKMISPRMGMVLLGTNNTSYPLTIGLKSHSLYSFTPMGQLEQVRLRFPPLRRSKMVNIITMNSLKLISGGRVLGMGQNTMSA